MRDRYQYFTQANIDRLRNTGFHAATQPLIAAIAEHADYLIPDQHLGDENRQSNAAVR